MQQLPNLNDDQKQEVRDIFEEFYENKQAASELNKKNTQLVKSLKESLGLGQGGSKLIREVFKHMKAKKESGEDSLDPIVSFMEQVDE